MLIGQPPDLQPSPESLAQARYCAARSGAHNSQPACCRAILSLVRHCCCSGKPAACGLALCYPTASIPSLLLLLRSQPCDDCLHLCHAVQVVRGRDTRDVHVGGSHLQQAATRSSSTAQAASALHQPRRKPPGCDLLCSLTSQPHSTIVIETSPWTPSHFLTRDLFAHAQHQHPQHQAYKTTYYDTPCPSPVFYLSYSDLHVMTQRYQAEYNDNLSTTILRKYSSSLDPPSKPTAPGPPSSP
jgi:hypothetical protein